MGGLSFAPVNAVKSFGRESNVTFCQTVCKCVVLSLKILRESPRISQQLSKPSGRKFNSLRRGNSFLQCSCAVTTRWVWCSHRGDSLSGGDILPNHSSPDTPRPAPSLGCLCTSKAALLSTALIRPALSSLNSAAKSLSYTGATAARSPFRSLSCASQSCQKG